MKTVVVRGVCGLLFVLASVSASAHAQKNAAPAPPPPAGPWMNQSLSPDQRAAMVLAQMTPEEKLLMVHGSNWADFNPAKVDAEHANLYSTGFVKGVPRLGIPDINMIDSAVGVRVATAQSRYATLLPSTLALAASWDTAAGMKYGQLIGKEVHELGYNMSIGGGVDLMREPRNGRNFEYAGEDPLLAGTMVGTMEVGVFSEHVMSDIKHFALNDEETARNTHNAIMGEKAMRESDLLAFEISLEMAKPSAVMCSYNKVNGDWACENDALLNKLLKNAFQFRGFVVSDWGGTHTTEKAALAGLDMEMPGGKYFGSPLAEAVKAGAVPQARIDDMVLRILRSMFAAGVVDDVQPRTIPDPFAGRDVAQSLAEETTVLLRNQNEVLPLGASVKRIAIIGGHADIGVLAGGGSATVHPPEGNTLIVKGKPAGRPVIFPSSPLKEIARRVPGVKVNFNDGSDAASAAAFARNADAAIVFVTQPMSEGHDAKDLSLPDNQDALIDAVAAVNPHTIVVVESGGPVLMPWHDRVAGIVEAWYPGIGGAQALSALLFGDVNVSAKLPGSFPVSEAQLPRPVLPGSVLNGAADDEHPSQPKPKTGKKTSSFDIDYNLEGARVGYKWFQSQGTQPLFPFGFGLSYTSFAYSALHIDAKARTVSFTVKNTGTRAGTEIAEVYVALPAAAGEKFKRLAGWQRVSLAPGESGTATVTIDKRMMSVFDTSDHSWKLQPGEFTVFVGGSSADLPLSAKLKP